MGFPPILRLGLAFALVLPAPASLAASNLNPLPRLPFLFDVTTLTTTMALPVTERIETVRMTEQQMRQRVARAPTDETVEPLTLILNDDDNEIAQTAAKVAKPGREAELARRLKATVHDGKPTRPGAGAKTVVLDIPDLQLIDKDAFADLYSRTHHKLTISTATLHRDPGQRAEFMRQIAPFFKKKERHRLQAKIMKGEDIDVDTELLPEFARKMVGKFIIYRGPNCFHAALAFHGPQMTSSSLINVKEETGYHRAMINYDELWRVLGRNFYEINPDKQPLKYGDMLVFFDVPQDAEGDLDRPVEFRWIRHTATYLFGGYTFSKGSKSPNTPYTVRTLAEEWKTWKRYTTNLGVKVFRRAQVAVSVRPPVDLADWMY
jgi:hypothetical protein